MSQSIFTFDEKLDSEFLESVYEGDMEHAQMIFEQFIKLTPIQMKEIESSYQEGVVEQFRQQVHKLKPIFSFVGLTQMTGQAETLEKKCKEIHSLAEVNQLYEDFKSDYANFFPIIENDFTRLKG